MGDVTATIPAGGATDAATNLNTTSSSTDNTVTWDTTSPDVTIDQGSTQADPTNASPIVFDVVFSEPVYGFSRRRCRSLDEHRRGDPRGHRHERCRR